MNTFTSDSINSSPVGITRQNINSVRRTIDIPIKKSKYNKKSVKDVKKLKEVVLKISDILSKIN